MSFLAEGEASGLASGLAAESGRGRATSAMQKLDYEELKAKQAECETLNRVLDEQQAAVVRLTKQLADEKTRSKVETQNMEQQLQLAGRQGDGGRVMLGPPLHQKARGLIDPHPAYPLRVKVADGLVDWIVNWNRYAPRLTPTCLYAYPYMSICSQRRLEQER
jgi:hypothetical protein